MDQLCLTALSFTTRFSEGPNGILHLCLAVFNGFFEPFNGSTIDLQLLTTPLKQPIMNESLYESCPHPVSRLLDRNSERL